MIEPIHTACKQCVFAKFDGITQTGCELGYIAKFREMNADILDVYDDDLEFYVINNKKCLGYRENSWFKKLDMENATIEEKKERFLKDNHINYLLVIDLSSLSIEELEQIKLKLMDVKYKPSKIIIIRYIKDLEKFSFDVIRSFLKDTSFDEIPWRVQTMEDNDIKFEDVLHNIITLNKSNRFIIYLRHNENNEHPVNDVLNHANHIIYDNMGKADIVSNKDKTCVLFSAPSYRFALIALKENIFSKEELYTYI